MPCNAISFGSFSSNDAGELPVKIEGEETAAAWLVRLV
jgi:hypothetical protein